MRKSNALLHSCKGRVGGAHQHLPCEQAQGDAYDEAEDGGLARERRGRGPVVVAAAAVAAVVAAASGGAHPAADR